VKDQINNVTEKTKGFKVSEEYNFLLDIRILILFSTSYTKYIKEEIKS